MTRWCALTVVLASMSLVTAMSLAMPLDPNLLEKLTVEGRLSERSLEQQAYALGVNNLGSNLVYTFEAGKTLSATTRQALVILVDFSDNVADEINYPASHYSDLLFSVGTYPTGSMRDFYLENSYGNFTVTGEITAWLRMPETYAYYVYGLRGIYGDYPHNCQKMVEDAVEAADPYVDFSEYDNDGPDGIPNSGDDDGYVDALFVVHAGRGYEQTGDPNDIHSHAWGTSYDVPVDGVYVSSYSTEPEDGKIGVFSHEFGHVLGCPDLYDYDYDSRGAGNWSVMAFGSWGNGGITPTHFDAWDKALLGFLNPIVPTTGLIDVSVPQVEDNAVAYKVWSGGSPSNEFFMFERREQTGFDAYLPGSGIVIYHIDEYMWGNDYQMCGSGYPHYLVAVEQADGECDLENYVNRGDTGDPWPGSGGAQNPNRAFNLLSTPDTRDYDNVATGVSIYNIHSEGADRLVSVAVNLVAPAVTVASPNGGESFAVGEQDTIRWVAFDDLAVDSVSVLLSIDGGSSYPYVLGQGEPNDSSLIWTITQPMSNHCRIKVVAYDRSGYSQFDVSDADFVIYDVSGVPSSTVASFGITSVRPNPGNTGVVVAFSSPHPAFEVSVYGVSGRHVQDLAVQPAGPDEGGFEAVWDGRTSDGRAASPGVYFIRVTSGNRSDTARFTLTR